MHPNRSDFNESVLPGESYSDVIARLSYLTNGKLVISKSGVHRLAEGRSSGRRAGSLL